MFKVYTEKIKQNLGNKKMLFVSNITSNKIEQKNFEKTNLQSQITNTIQNPITSKKKQNYEKNKNNIIKDDKANRPIKKIFFKLCRINLSNSNKEKKKPKQKKINNNNKTKYKQSKKVITNKNTSDKNYSTGRWQIDEHQRFIDGVIKYGNNWRLVQKYIGTRTGTQTRSHAQKFFEKLRRSKIFKSEKYDFSKNSLKLLHDIMVNLSEKEYNQILKKLHSLSNKMNLAPNKKRKNITEKEKESKDSYDINNSYEKDNSEEDNYNNKQGDNYEKMKFNNKGYYYSENYNNKINTNNNNDYFIYNYEYYNNINFNHCNFGIKSRKGSDIFNNQRNKSLSELNEIKEENENLVEYNRDINSNIDINEDNTLNNKQLNNSYFSLSQISSRKMSLEEKIIATVY